VTNSDNFPTTPGAFQTTPQPAGGRLCGEAQSSGDALVYSTYLAAARLNVINDLAVNSTGTPL